MATATLNKPTKPGNKHYRRSMLARLRNGDSGVKLRVLTAGPKRYTLAAETETRLVPLGARTFVKQGDAIQHGLEKTGQKASPGKVS